MGGEGLWLSGIFLASRRSQFQSWNLHLKALSGKWYEWPGRAADSLSRHSTDLEGLMVWFHSFACVVSFANQYKKLTLNTLNYVPEVSMCNLRPFSLFQNWNLCVYSELSYLPFPYSCMFFETTLLIYRCEMMERCKKYFWWNPNVIIFMTVSGYLALTFTGYLPTAQTQSFT